jgi:hypothetical protein
VKLNLDFELNEELINTKETSCLKKKYKDQSTDCDAREE